MAVPSRRAERFAAAVDGGRGGPVDGRPADPGAARLAGLAHRLGDLPAPTPRPAARAAALAAFAAGAAELAHHAAPPAAHAAARTAAHAANRGAGRAASRGAVHAIGQAAAAHGLLVPVALGLSAAAVAAVGVGYAAHRSLPGDPFYALKQATESVQLDLAGGGVSGARERLAIAHARLDEIQAEAAKPPSSLRTDRIASLVGALDHDVALASRSMLAGGTAAETTWRADIADFRHGLAALPGNARIPVVITSEAKLDALFTLTAGLQPPSGGVSGPFPGSSTPAGTGPSNPLTGPAGTGPAPASSAPGATFSTLPGDGVPLGGPTAPSGLPSGLPSTVASAPPSLPTSLAPSGLPSDVPSLPVTLPSAVSSIINGLTVR